MSCFRSATHSLAACVLLGMLGGCATTRIDSQWKSPDFGQRSLISNRVLVTCKAPDETLRRLCEDQWLVKLGARGISATRSYSLSGFPPVGASNSEAARLAAKDRGTLTVVNMELTPSSVAVVNHGPQLGVGIGGGSGGYHGGGFSFGGLGVSFPLGGATVTQGMAAATTVLEAESGKLIWSGNASTTADVNVAEQVSALTRATVDELMKVGLFQLERN